MRKGCICDTALFYFVTFKVWHWKADQYTMKKHIKRYTLKDTGILKMIRCSKYNSSCVCNSRRCKKTKAT